MEEDSYIKNYPTIPRAHLSFYENQVDCRVSYHHINKVIVEFDIRQDFNKKDINNIFKDISKDKSQIIDMLKFLAEDASELVDKINNINLDDWIYEYSKIKLNKFFDDYADQILKNNISYVVNYFKKKEEQPVKKKKPPMLSNIYLMRNNRNGYIKIGYSSNPEYRESTLQSEEPDIELIYSIRTYMHYEIQLHEMYADKRLRGEWFKLSLDDIEDIKKFLELKEIT